MPANPRHLCTLLILALAGMSCSGRLVPASVDLPSAPPQTLRQQQFKIDLPLQLIQEFDLHSTPKERLVLADNLLFVATRSGRLETYDLDQLKRIGKSKVPGGGQAKITLVNRNIMLSLEFGRESLILIDPKKNIRVWVAELGSISTSPQAFGNRVFVASLYRGVFAVDAATGETLWQKELDSQLHVDPLVFDSALYQGTESGKLIKLSLDTGEELWRSDLGSPVSAAPIAGDNRIIVCTYAGEVFAISPRGETLWQKRIGTEVRRTPAYAGDRLYTAGQDGIVRALAGGDGREIWRYETDTVIGTALLPTADHVAFGTLDKGLVFLSKDTGDLLWEVELYGRVRTDPIIWQDKFIVGSESNKLYVFETQGMTN